MGWPVTLGSHVDTLSGLLPYINFGVLGLVLLALLTGFLYTKGYVDEMRERHKQEVDEYKQALALERQRNELGEMSARMLHELMITLRKEVK